MFKLRIFVIAISVLVAANVVAGLLIVGGPQQERMRRFDDERVSNLQEVQYNILQFWQQKKLLPQNLDELRDDLTGYIPPRDPETGDSYEYKVLGPLNFELCANFALRSEEPQITVKRSPQELKPAMEDSWAHDQGRICFSRIIDPERHKPLVEPPIIR